jgi:Lipase (class 3)
MMLKLVHSANQDHGIYQIAQNILTELKYAGVLKDLLLNPGSPTSGYNLVCTGHSLGAGASSLLAFILKNDPEFEAIHSQIYAICYSTPGTMISIEAIDYFKTFCTSIVLGDDIIPRLNPRSVSNLKQLITDELSNCNERKVDVIANALLKKVFRKPKRPLSLDEQESILESFETEFTGTCMYLPGAVLHFAKFPDGEGEQESAIRDKSYTPYWVDATDFDQILISWTMGVEHLPNRFAEALQEFK